MNMLDIHGNPVDRHQTTPAKPEPQILLILTVVIIKLDCSKTPIITTLIDQPSFQLKLTIRIKPLAL